MYYRILFFCRRAVCGIVPERSEWDTRMYAGVDFAWEQEELEATLREMLAIGVARP
ncbi:MAG: hypothetical protein HYZ25_18705 [Chloroflexi bacterium]|nr:hypothetical protein [Chloroflexota bacterium]